MLSGRLRVAVSRHVSGPRFLLLLSMGPLAAAAILALRSVGLAARTPIWLIPTVIVVGQMVTNATDLAWSMLSSRTTLHAKVAARAIVVTAAIYATGWGPALAIGLVLVGQETLTSTGADTHRVVMGWSLACLAAGEGLVALGWAPSLVPVPAVHGLAVLAGIGIAFSYRSLTSALLEKEAAAELTRRQERRFRALVQSSHDIVFVVDAARAVRYASPSCIEVLGFAPDELLGMGKGALVHGEDIEPLREILAATAQVPGARAEFSMRVRHAAGGWRWLEGVATNLLDDPSVQGMVINATDASDRRRRLERQAAIAELGREALREVSLDALIERGAVTITDTLGADACRISGVFDHTVEITAPGSDHAACDNTVPGSTESQSPALHVPMGDPIAPLAHIDVVASHSLTPDDEQFVEAIASILLSSIVRSRAEEAIRHQAMHDPLTGLPNRVLFRDRLEHALGRRARVGGYVAVLVVDLDGFKTVNDSLGHLAGDSLLNAVAERFGASLRDFDTIARLGGDEFAILVDDLDAPDQAGRVAQRVLDVFSQPLPITGREIAIGASVGVSLADRSDALADTLLSNADAAMYRAKREGKGCYRVFEMSMHTAAVERMNLEQALRAAVATGALTIYYQPVVDTLTGRVLSFEALARWHDPTQGFVPPDIFIPLAEESGLIIELGRAILRAACQQAARWHDQFPSIRPGVSVNVSRLQLVDRHFAADVAAALTDAGIEPSTLTLEITESVLVGDAGRVIATLDELRRTGVRIAIDDFGTGYSSFAALAELPIDTLKIDKRFIDKLLTGHDGRGFVNAILQLAYTLHLETTAEGVEEPEQRDALQRLGCTHIQGYLYAKPMPAEQTHQYLNHQGTELAHVDPSLDRAR